MIISCALWVCGYLYSNDHNVSPIQTSMLRGFMIIIFTGLLCRWYKLDINLKSEDKIVSFRNNILVLESFIVSGLQFYIPLGIFHTLTLIGPIFISIFQYIYQKKSLKIQEVITFGITFVGIILTSNGNLIQKMIYSDYSFTTDFANYKSNDPKVIAACSLLFVIFMIIWAYAIYKSSKLSTSPHVINFLFGIRLFLISSFLYPFIGGLKAGQPMQIDSQVFYSGLIYSGLLLSICEILFVVAIMISQNVGITSMLFSFNIAFGYFISVVRYGQEINIFCFLGSVLIIIGLAKLILH